MGEENFPRRIEIKYLGVLLGVKLTYKNPAHKIWHKPSLPNIGSDSQT